MLLILCDALLLDICMFWTKHHVINLTADRSLTMAWYFIAAFVPIELVHPLQ